MKLCQYVQSLWGHSKNSVLENEDKNNLPTINIK